MDESASKLTSLMAERAASCVSESSSGRDNARVDIHSWLGRMTLQVVGRSAYGVDFGVFEEEEAGLQADGCSLSTRISPGMRLAEACR